MAAGTQPTPVRNALQFIVAIAMAVGFAWLMVQFVVEVVPNPEWWMYVLPVALAILGIVLAYEDIFGW